MDFPLCAGDALLMNGSIRHLVLSFYDLRSGHCICAPGYCQINGLCFRKQGILHARVVPINKEKPQPFNAIQRPRKPVWRGECGVSDVFFCCAKVPAPRGDCPRVLRRWWSSFCLQPGCTAGTGAFGIDEAGDSILLSWV